jgi:TolA-binding protein
LSAHNYLDDLDNLLDDPKSTQAPLLSTSNELASESDLSAVSDVSQAKDTSSEAYQASNTWAKVIESASQALHDSTQLSQETIRKNMDLAKEQQESIKELSDAASGWRHATRQAVQEVNSTKKNIIILTVISALIAIAGFGTTIGVMLQSRTSFIVMSNAILENVDEHQTLVSKTLTLKIDELASTIEQMQASIDQMNQPKTIKSPANAKQLEPDESITAETKVINPNASIANEAVIKDTQTKGLVTEIILPSVATAPLTPSIPAPVISLESWQALASQIEQLQQKLQLVEQNLLNQHQEQNKQWLNLVTQVDEKLANRLAKLPNAINNEAGKSSVNVTNVVDTKPILDQLTKLRQEIAELRLLQQSLKEQMNQVKQSVTDSANKPYQYRLPQEAERYPR